MFITVLYILEARKDVDLSQLKEFSKTFKVSVILFVFHFCKINVICSIIFQIAN